MPTESNLLKAFRTQIKKWLDQRPKQIFPNNIWVQAREGEIYIRFQLYFNRIDLANFSIKRKYWGKGIARSIIHDAIAQDVDCVRIESIQKDGWFEKVSKYQFDGFDTQIVDQSGDGFQFDINFVRKIRATNNRPS